MIETRLHARPCLVISIETGFKSEIQLYLLRSRKYDICIQIRYTVYVQYTSDAYLKSFGKHKKMERSTTNILKSWMKAKRRADFTFRPFSPPTPLPTFSIYRDVDLFFISEDRINRARSRRVPRGGGGRIYLASPST